MYVYMFTKQPITVPTKNNTIITQIHTYIHAEHTANVLKTFLRPRPQIFSILKHQY